MPPSTPAAAHAIAPRATGGYLAWYLDRLAKKQPAVAQLVKAHPIAIVVGAVLIVATAVALVASSGEQTNSGAWRIRAEERRAWERCTANEQRAWITQRYECDYRLPPATPTITGEPNEEAKRAIDAWTVARMDEQKETRCAVVIVGGIRPGLWMDTVGDLQVAQCQLVLLPAAGRDGDAAVTEISSRRSTPNRADQTQRSQPPTRTHALPVPKGASLSDYIGRALDATNADDAIVVLPYRITSAMALKALGKVLRARPEVNAVAFSWSGAGNDANAGGEAATEAREGARDMAQDNLAFAVSYFDALSFDTVALPNDAHDAPAVQLSGVPGGAMGHVHELATGLLEQPLATSQKSPKFLLLAMRRETRLLDNVAYTRMACSPDGNMMGGCSCRAQPALACATKSREQGATPSSPGVRFHDDVNYVRGAQALRTGRRGGASSSDAIRRHQEAVAAQRAQAHNTFMEDEFEDAHTHAWREARSVQDRAAAEGELRHHNLSPEEHIRDAESSARQQRLTELTRTRIMNLTRMAMIGSKAADGGMDDAVTQRMAELYAGDTQLEDREVTMDLDADQDSIMRDVVERQEREHAVAAYEASEQEMIELLQGNTSAISNGTTSPDDEGTLDDERQQSALSFAYNAVKGAASRFFTRVGLDAQRPGLENFVPPAPKMDAVKQAVDRHPLDPFATTRQGLVKDPRDGSTVLPWGGFVRRCMNAKDMVGSPHVLLIGSEILRSLYSDIGLALKDGYADYYEPAHSYYELSMVREGGHRKIRRTYGETLSTDTWNCGPVGKERGVLDGDIEEEDMQSLAEGTDRAKDDEGRRRFQHSGWDARPIMNLGEEAPINRYDESCALKPCRLQELRTFNVPQSGDTMLKSIGGAGGFSLSFLGVARPHCRGFPDMLRKAAHAAEDDRKVGTVLVSNPGLWVCANGDEERWSHESGEVDFRLQTDLRAMVEEIERTFPDARKIWISRTWTTNYQLQKCMQFVDDYATRTLPETWERVDVGTATEGRCDLLASDGMHLNAMGIRAVADSLLAGICIDPLKGKAPVSPPPMPSTRGYPKEKMQQLCERKRIDGFTSRLAGLSLMVDGEPGTFRDRQQLRSAARVDAIKNKTDEWLSATVRERIGKIAHTDLRLRGGDEDDPLTFAERAANASYLHEEGGAAAVEHMIATATNVSVFAENATRSVEERESGMSAREKLERAAQAYEHERKEVAARRGGNGGWFGSRVGLPDTSKSLEAYEAGKKRDAMREAIRGEDASEQREDSISDDAVNALPASAGDETMAPYTSTGTGADVVGDGFVARQTPTDAVEAAASAAREHPIKGVFTVGPPTAPTATPRKAAGKGGKSKKGGKKSNKKARG